MAKKKSSLDTAVDFFYEHAGFGYTPGKETKEQGRKRTALALAKAERDAASLGITFDWNYDEYPDISWMDSEDKRRLKNDTAEILQCVARDENGKVVASLGGIHFLTGTDKERAAGRAYKRVVEAELAMEALSELE